MNNVRIYCIFILFIIAGNECKLERFKDCVELKLYGHDDILGGINFPADRYL